MHGKPIVWTRLAGPADSPFLWGRATDLIWVACGGFFAFLLIAAPLSLVPSAGAALTTLFLHLGIVCNYPHYSATYQVIVRERRAKPASFALLLASLPVMAALYLLGAKSPDFVWPLLLRGYLTWSAHHYAAQHFGIASLHSARSGRALGKREKSLLQFAFLGLGAFMMITANTAGGDATTAAKIVGLANDADQIPTAGFPVAFYDLALLVAVAAIGSALVANTLLRRRTGKGFGIQVWLLLATAFAWFVVPELRRPDGSSWLSPNLAVCLLGAPPFFHCAQYLAVIGWRNRLGGDVRPVWIYAGLVAGGLALFHLPVRALAATTGVDELHTILLLVAIVNLHHFFIDGLIWRRKRAPASAPAPGPVPSVSASPAPAAH